MFLDILKAYIIGICAAAPIGPVAIMVLQKSLSHGRRTGFVSALGSTVIDTAYAVAAVFALAAVRGFLERNNTVILIVGGVVLMGLGVSMAFRDPFRRMKTGEESDRAVTKNFLETLVCALSNPGAVFVMLALFSFFGVEAGGAGFAVAPVILAVSAGSATYWFFFTWFVSRWRDTFRIRTLFWISRLSGIVILIIGFALLMDGLYDVIFA